MALRFLDGFDSIDVYGATSTSFEGQLKLKYSDANITTGGYSPVLVNDRFNAGLALEWKRDDSKWLKAPIAGSPSTVVIGFALKTPRGSSIDHEVVRLLNATGLEVADLNIDDYNHIYSGSSSNPIIFVDEPLRQDTWYYIEWKIFASNTGTSEIHINGEVVASVNADTMGSSTPITHAVFSSLDSGSQLDDIYILDNTGTHNTFLGPGIIESLIPNADTLENDFVPSTGSDHYAMIDEIPCDLATSYIESFTTGDQDRCDYPSLSEITGDVHAVMVWTVAAASTGSYTLKVSVHDGTTRDTDTGSTVDSSSYVGFLRALDQTPSATSWTVTLVNGSSFGSEVG